MEYKKPPITIEKQIELLENRGLIIDDKAKVERYLKNISYYHLGIYFKHFQKDDDIFFVGTTFDNVLNIYVFDQKLRLLLLDVLERIEKSFKCRMTYELSMKTNDSCWISDVSQFENADYHKRLTIEILDKLVFSKEAYIKHYYDKYHHPKYPPIWMIIETLTFGQCIMIYGSLSKENQELIADTYDINKKFIYSWMYALSIVRNFCAHHSRLWNNKFIVKPNQRHGFYGQFFNNNNGNRLFNYLVIMHIINCKFNPGSSWVEKLENIIIEHEINVSHMGFPGNWKERFQKIRENEESLNAL